MLNNVSEEITLCYQRAGECHAKAEDASNEAARQEYFDLERRWLMLARGYELSERLTSFTKEGGRRLGGSTTPEPPHADVAGPTCPQCGKKMMLRVIETCVHEWRNADLCTFTCECGFNYQQPVPNRAR
jgi:hypothetical protein